MKKMTRTIPIHYLKEDSALDAEVSHLLPSSERWEKLNHFGAHIDDCFTIIVVTKGSGETDIDFRTVRLSEGELGIIAPGQVHSNIHVTDCEAWMLRLSPEMMDNDYRHMIDEYSMTDGCLSLSRQMTDTICDSLRLLSVLLKSLETGMINKGVVFNMLNVILGIVTPEMIDRQSRPMLRTGEITVRFKQLLRQHIMEEKRPSFYASLICISEVYLNEAVKKSTGKSPSEWINATIVLEAKRLLRSTSMTVKEIAHELGYGDHAYFSRFFKKNSGMTPLDFRRHSHK